ncbi:MAG TPA: hypothetical protein VFA07_03165 [Chthonomonadaceae bacterium]|nr:hypothetical protein [Chthonomonadaceae bacterium]
MHAYDPEKDPLSVDKWMLPEHPLQPRKVQRRPAFDAEETPLPRARDLKFVATALVLLVIALAFLLVTWPDMPVRMAGQ